MAKIKYIQLDAPVKNIICHKPKPKRIREYQSKGIPKTYTSRELCLKCEQPFTSKNGFRLCESCRNQNRNVTDFGDVSYRSNPRR